MMTNSIKTNRLPALVCGCLALLVIQFPLLSFAFDITIEVSPKTLNIQSEGQVVTVHTDVAYWAVDVSSVYLNGVWIRSWKADNRGNFVAKFSMDDVKTLDGLIIDGYNTLQLVGATKDGEAFSGEQEIMVIDVQPSKR